MRIKLYRAPSLPEAMAQLRAELGPEAFIISNRRSGDGVELTAAIEAPEPPAPPASSSLAWHGVPASLIPRLTACGLAEALRRHLRFGALDLAGTPPLMFVGPPGAGKTLTVARLATRLVLAGQSPVVITADGRRAGAPEELSAYTSLLGLSLIVASDPPTLARALPRRPAGAALLIDTAGVNPFDAEEMNTLAALAQTAAATICLVLPAGFDAADSAEFAAAFARAGATFLVVTRLDIARRLGGVVTASFAGGLTLVEAGIGPGATDGLAALTPDLLAARLSRAQPAAAPREVDHAYRS